MKEKFNLTRIVVIALIVLAIGLVGLAISLDGGECSGLDCPDSMDTASNVEAAAPGEENVENTPPDSIASKGPLNSFGDGMWEVGVQIRPGTYSAMTPEGAYCHWQRWKELTDCSSDITAEDTVTGGTKVLVTITGSDMGFKSENCGTWELVEE